MSLFEVLLLCAVFASSLLVEVRLPVAEVSAANLLVPLLALFLAWRRRESFTAAVQRHRGLLAAAVAVYAWSWISAANGIEPAMSMRYVLKYTTHLVVFAALLIALYRREAAATAQLAAYCFLVVLGAFGVVEFWFPQCPIFTLVRHPTVVYPRVESLMIWPNQFGVLMATSVAWGASLLHRRRIGPPGFYGPLAVLLVALVLSGSRNGWFVLIVLIATLFAARVVALRQVLLIALVFGMPLMTLGVPTAQLGLTTQAARPLEQRTTPPVEQRPQGTSSPEYAFGIRQTLWRAALAEIRRNPVSGTGLEVFATKIGPPLVGRYWINTHNLFLNVAVELGLVGAALVAFFAYLLMRAGDPRRWDTTIPLLGIGIGQIFDCFTYDHAFMTFAVFFAASYVSLPFIDEQQSS